MKFGVGVSDVTRRGKTVAMTGAERTRKWRAKLEMIARCRARHERRRQRNAGIFVPSDWFAESDWWAGDMEFAEFPVRVEERPV